MRLAWLLAALALAGCGGDGSVEGTGGAAGAAGSGAGSAGGAGAGGSGGSALPSGFHVVGDWESPSASELAPLSAMIGDARVIALGESVHTSGGYSAAKAGIVRHLVDHGGVRVLALETPRTDAEAVSAWLETCSGEPDEAMKGIFWVFADESFSDLLGWLCQRNQEHPDDPVAFVGFDVQQPWHDGPALAAFLETLSLPAAGALATKIASCDGVSYPSSKDYYGSGAFQTPIPPDQFELCTQATAAIGTFLDAHSAEIEAETGERELRLARLALLGLDSWERSKYWLGLDPTASYQARDSAMATVFTELLALDHPGERAVIWAHNFHVRHESLESSAYPPNVACTGTLLREELGSDYVAFGLLSTRTATNWPGVSCGSLPDPGPNELESLFEKTGAESAIVDLADSGLSLIEPGERYGFGINAGGENAVPAQQFRGFVWLSESPAMQSVYGPTACDD